MEVPQLDTCVFGNNTDGDGFGVSEQSLGHCGAQSKAERCCYSKGLL